MRRHQHVGVRKIDHHDTGFARQRIADHATAGKRSVGGDGYRKTTAKGSQSADPGCGLLRPGCETVADSGDVPTKRHEITWCRRGQGNMERPALQAEENVAGPDLAALVHRKQKSRADEQQTRPPGSGSHQHRPW